MAPRRRPLAACQLLALGALACAGCFLPPGDTFFANRSPRALDSSPPTPVFIPSTSQLCSPLEFSVSAADPDLEDLLRYRFFADDELVAEGVVFNPEQRATRAVRPSWTVVPAKKGSPFAAEGTHVLELLLADADIVGRVPVPRDRLLDGGLIPAGSDLLRWLVDVRSPPPAGCP